MLARLSGRDQAQLSRTQPRSAARPGQQNVAIIRSDPASRSVYLNWQERSKELVPQVSESEARRLGISNEEIATSLKIAFGGLPAGLPRWHAQAADSGACRSRSGLISTA